MVRNCIILLLAFFTLGATYQEGDFWRDKEKEQQGWVVVEQNYSHIIYKGPKGELWTQDHASTAWCKVKDAYKCIIDRRENTRKRAEWDKKNWFRKKFNNWSYKICKFLNLDKWLRREFTEEPPPIVMVGDRILDYEELYYCEGTYQPEWNCEKGGE